MAAPVFASGNHVTFSNTVNKPSGTAAGDLLVIATISYDNPVSVTCTGFTRRINNVDHGSAFDHIWVSVLDRVADGSEGASFTVSTSGGYTDTLCGRYTGASAAPYDTSNWAGSTGGNTTTASAPAVTTTTADELLIIVHGGYNAPGVSAAYSGFSIDVGPNDTVNYMLSKAQAAATTVGPFTQTQSSTTYTTVTLAYKAAGGGPATIEATASAAWGALTATASADVTPGGPAAEAQIFLPRPILVRR